MGREAMVTELLAVQQRAERTTQNIDQISSSLSVERQTLRQAVEEYGEKRVELLKQELEARGLTWCTDCSEVIPENEAEFLLVEGKEEYSTGYQGSCYGIRDFSNLHRVCPICRQRAADNHGKTGSYDRQLQDQTSFYAFPVEQRDDGYYARKFGNWVKLDDENYKLDEPPSRLVEKLAEEWNLPPRIEVELNGIGFEKGLVIHERAMAEVS